MDNLDNYMGLTVGSNRESGKRRHESGNRRRESSNSRRENDNSSCKSGNARYLTSYILNIIWQMFGICLNNTSEFYPVPRHGVSPRHITMVHHHGSSPWFIATTHCK